MVKLRDVVIFFAGAQFFHTLCHILLPIFIKLPIDIEFMELTPTINYWAIVINAVIFLLLLWWAARLPKY